MNRNDIEQAINSGEIMLKNLNKALKYAKSARRWGRVDLFTNGIAGLIKQRKMDRAKKYVNQAQTFEDRLTAGFKKTEVYLPGMNTPYEKLYHYTDSFAADYLEQEDIVDCVNSIAYSIKGINEVLENLRNTLEKVKE